MAPVKMIAAIFIMNTGKEKTTTERYFLFRMFCFVNYGTIQIGFNSGYRSTD